MGYVVLTTNYFEQGLLQPYFMLGFMQILFQEAQHENRSMNNNKKQNEFNLENPSK